MSSQLFLHRLVLIHVTFAQFRPFLSSPVGIFCAEFFLWSDRSDEELSELQLLTMGIAFLVMALHSSSSALAVTEFDESAL